jgi:putative protease
MSDIKVATVDHYYDKIGVAILKIESDLKVGEKIKFSRGGEDLFEQVIDSMQVEHENVEVAKVGDMVGIKVSEEVKEGAEVYKIS